MTRWDVFVWLVAPGGALVAVLATAICVLKRRRVWALAGLAASAVAVAVMVGSWSASTESFEDLVLAATFVFAVVPSALVVIVGALLPACSGSWWERRAVGPAPTDGRAATGLG